MRIPQILNLEVCERRNIPTMIHHLPYLAICGSIVRCRLLNDQRCSREPPQTREEFFAFIPRMIESALQKKASELNRGHTTAMRRCYEYLDAGKGQMVQLLASLRFFLTPCVVLSLFSRVVHKSYGGVMRMRLSVRCRCFFRVVLKTNKSTRSFLW